MVPRRKQTTGMMKDSQSQEWTKPRMEEKEPTIEIKTIVELHPLLLPQNNVDFVKGCSTWGTKTIDGISIP